jgi:hypothetical protein
LRCQFDHFHIILLAVFLYREARLRELLHERFVFFAIHLDADHGRFPEDILLIRGQLLPVRGIHDDDAFGEDMTPDYSAGKQRKVCSSGQPDDMVKEIDRYRGVIGWSGVVKRKERQFGPNLTVQS